MVTTKLFGGLGNQMFQIAATIGYARKYNMEYRIPLKADHPWPTYYWRGVDYMDSAVYTTMQYREPAMFYDKRPYDIKYRDIPWGPNVSIEGHFQSEKYFDHCRDEIRNLFNKSDFKYDGWVSVHVRRGDYLTMQGHFSVITDAYLQYAIGYMEKQGYKKFLIFGDDQDWNREYINEHRYPGLEIKHCGIINPQTDMLLAASCDHHIGSNSSYSWWIHYLSKNENKIGIFPEVWFGPAYGEVDTSDLYPRESIKLPVR